MQVIKRLVFLTGMISCLFVAAFANDTTKVDRRTRLINAHADAGITVPKGFKAIVFADTLGRARHLVVNTNGDVYVKLERLKNGEGIFRLKDTNGDSKADNITGFGNYVGTGITIKN